MGFHTKAVTSLRKNPGGTGSAGRQRAGESACAAYVRHKGLYVNMLGDIIERVYDNQWAGRGLFQQKVLLMIAVCYGGESRRIAAPRCPLRRGIYWLYCQNPQVLNRAYISANAQKKV